MHSRSLHRSPWSPANKHTSEKKTLTNTDHHLLHRLPGTLLSFQALPCITKSRTFNNTLTTARCHIRALLNDRNLSFLRDGFPFRYTHGYDSSTDRSCYHASYESYEISEEIVVPYGTGTATNTRLLLAVSYCPPETGNRCDASGRFFSWTLFVSAPTDPRISPTSQIRMRSASPRANVAQVLIDPTILNSPHVEFGQLLISDPAVMLHALSLSLELGTCVTIYHSSSLTDTPQLHHPFKFCGGPGGDTQSGIVYVATNNEGEQSVLFRVGLSSECWLNMLMVGKGLTT